MADFALYQREEKIKELEVLLKVFVTQSLHPVIRDKAESAIHNLINELYSFKPINIENDD